MTILYIILIVVLLLLIIPLFISKDMNYEKSIKIHAPRENVWPHVNSLSAMDKWSPWNDRDPNMERALTGTDGTVGARQSWKSNVKNVGEGSQTITAVHPPERLETKLEFLKPFKSVADAYVTLSAAGEETQVTWGFKSKMPYPMNIMKLFMNFEKSMDGDFGAGLDKLKNICEGG